jgi:hypothetical protein
MLALEFQHTGKMTSGNPRGERHGKDGEGELAVDLDFSAEVPASVLKQLAIGEKVNYETFLWDKDGQVRNLGIKRIQFDRIIEDQVLYLTIEDEKHILDEVTVKKVQAEPVFGHRVKLTFQCQAHPKSEDAGPILQGLVTPVVDIRLRRQEVVDGEDAGEE